MNCLIKTKKFHKVIFKRISLRKYNYEEQTIRNLLVYYLSLACEKYNTEATFNKFLGSNYDLRYEVSVSPVTTYSNLSYTLKAVDPKYINDPNYNKSMLINSFYECIKPVIKKNSFDKKLFSRAKEIYLSNLLYSLENEHKNAIDFTINSYYEGTNGKVCDGDIKILNEINIKDLYNYYLSTLNDEYVDYVCGDIDIEINDNSTITPKEDIHFINKITENKVITKPLNSNQCYLQVIYNVGKFSNSFDFYTTTILNYEFGGKSNSRLFQIIREKYGLCYHISSTYYGARGIILLTAIINKKDVDEVLSKINEVYNSLLDNFDLTSAKNYFINELLVEKDKMGYLIQNKFLEDYFLTKYPSDNESIYYNSVSLEDIRRVYNTIKNDFICIYGGDSNE